MSFQAVKERVFAKNCVACHGDAGGVTLESYSDVLKNLNRIQRAVLVDHRMPPGNPLGEAERNLLRSWIDAGAPENPTAIPPVSQPTGAPPGDSEPVVGSALSYAFVREKVLEPSCISCHGVSGGVNLETYDSAKRSLSAISQAALVDRSMPPAGKLTEKQREILSIWILEGAPENPGDAPGPQPNPVPGPSGSAGRVTYATIRDRVLAPRCEGCHGDSGGVNLESYASVQREIGRIAVAALVDKVMPPSGPLSVDDASLLAKWIRDGAPEGDGPAPSPTASPSSAPSPAPSPTPSAHPSPIPSPMPSASPSPSPSPPSDALQPTFASISRVIFQPRCIQCHSPQGSARRVPLGTRDDLLNSPRDLVLPGDPDESGLVIAVGRTDSRRMPPPSSGEAPLTAWEIAIVRQWIQNGAPE